MTITNFLSRSGERKAAGRFRAQRIHPAALEEIKSFAEELELPEPEYKLNVEIKDSINVAGRERVPYCLMLYAPQEDISFLNAGYAAGQITSYLRFKGFTASVSRELPSIRQKEDGRICVGIIAFGKAEQPGNPNQERKKQDEGICVCRDLQGRWTEDVLALAKKRFHISSHNVRIMREENCVYFSPKFRNGKRGTVSEFETGIAIAYALAAAEELWVDLVVAESDRSLHTICLMTDQG